MILKVEISELKYKKRTKLVERREDKSGKGENFYWIY